MDKALKLLGLMRKANRVSLTEEKCREDIRAGRSKLVLISSDCSESVATRIRKLAENHNVKCINAGYTKYELASAAGSGLCVVISVNDSGFARAWLDLKED